MYTVKRCKVKQQHEIVGRFFNVYERPFAVQKIIYQLKNENYKKKTYLYIICTLNCTV